jgi:hypothetical protein
MPGLRIPPHSRRLSGLAVAFLLLLAIGSFVSGLNHQLITGRDPAAFPAPPVAQVAAPGFQAPPAPPLQVANVRPSRHAAKDRVTVDTAGPAESPAPSDAAAPPAVDAAATAPDPVGAPAVPNI